MVLAANVADVMVTHALLHGKEDSVFGDSGYTGAEKRDELQSCEAAFFIAAKRPPNQAIGNKRERAREERWEHFKASVRAKVEHPFRVIKRQFGYTKVRYRGLAKNTAWQLKPPESCRNRTKRSILHVAAVQEAGI